MVDKTSKNDEQTERPSQTLSALKRSLNFISNLDSFSKTPKGKRLSFYLSLASGILVVAVGIKTLIPGKTLTTPICASYETQNQRWDCMIEQGTINVDERIAMAQTTRIQNFPETKNLSLEQLSVGSAAQRFENSVRVLAMDPIRAKREALVLARHPDTSASGLDKLIKLAKTDDDWRQIGEIAYTWDTSRALTAYEMLKERGSKDVWDYISLSRLYIQNGDLDSAKSALDVEKFFNMSPQDQSVIFDEIGNIASAQGDLSAALRSYQESLEIKTRLVKDDNANSRLQLNLSVSYDNIGNIAYSQGDNISAINFYKDSFEIRMRLVTNEPENANYKHALALSHINLGRMARAKNNLVAAQQRYQAALDILEWLTKGDKINVSFLRDLSVCYELLGDIVSKQNDLSGAQSFYQKSWVIREHLTQIDPSNTSFKRVFSLSYNRLGEIAQKENNFLEARKAYQESLGIIESISKSDATNTDFQRDLSVIYERLGDVELAESNFAAAREAYQNSLDIGERLAESDPTNTQLQRDIIVSNVKIAKIDTENACSYLLSAHKITFDLSLSGRLSQRDAFMIEGLKKRLTQNNCKTPTP